MGLDNKNILIKKEDTNVEDAIGLLNNNGRGCIAVVDSIGKFIGIITDGDIRKAILYKKLDLESIINTTPIVMQNTSSKEKIIQQMKINKRRHMPIIDNSGLFVDLVYLDDIEYNIKTNKIIIMAGGLGSRLGELTKTTPKPMLNIGNKPMLENLILQFKEHGYIDFYISVNYKSEVIIDYFGDGSNLGVNIKYLKENERMGTAGALKLIDKNEIGDSFFLINGDVFTTLNFEQIYSYHYSKKADATICVKEMSSEIPYGVVETDKDNYLIGFKEKPKTTFFVNMGIYLFNNSCLDFLPKDTYIDMPNFLEKLLKNNKSISVFKTREYWVDMGKPEDYRTINDSISKINSILE